ncbi:MAG: hypothetical protein JJU36_00645 [Phycisphaeraceae bacterium]|nr:hypothetical protein [Phycisphaeraceae bacterium]
MSEASSGLRWIDERPAAAPRPPVAHTVEALALRIGALLAGYGRPWMLCGADAAGLIDQTAAHSPCGSDSLVVAIFREHQHNLREYLFGWRFQIRMAGVLLDWPRSQWLEEPYYRLEASRPEWSPSRLLFTLEHHRRGFWIDRSDTRRALPLDRLVHRTRHGLPVMNLPAIGCRAA